MALLNSNEEFQDLQKIIDTETEIQKDQSILGTQIPIHSDRYDTDGMIRIAHGIISVTFVYNGRQYHFACECIGDIKEECTVLMESMIENICSDQPTMLHDWKIAPACGNNRVMWGIVTGHIRLPDALYIHTSELQSYKIDHEAKELIAMTRNTKYHCPLTECDFEGQNENPAIFPEFEKIKAAYSKPETIPELEEDTVLLTISNSKRYFFHSMFFRPKGYESALQCKGQAHIGMFQDSFLIRKDFVIKKEENNNDPSVDVRYFPHTGNIEFYELQINGMKLYVKNSGTAVLYVFGGFTGKFGIIRIEPGETKEMCEENEETTPPLLPDGDLYYV